MYRQGQGQGQMSGRARKKRTSIDADDQREIGGLVDERERGMACCVRFAEHEGQCADHERDQCEQPSERAGAGRVRLLATRSHPTVPSSARAGRTRTVMTVLHCSLDRYDAFSKRNLTTRHRHSGPFGRGNLGARILGEHPIRSGFLARAKVVQVVSSRGDMGGVSTLARCRGHPLAIRGAQPQSRTVTGPETAAATWPTLTEKVRLRNEKPREPQHARHETGPVNSHGVQPVSSLIPATPRAL
jgi:hypothetical protein